MTYHYLKMQRKWVGLLFNSGLLHNFNQVKVKKVCLRMDFTSYKTLLFSFKNANVKMKVGIIAAIK